MKQRRFDLDFVRAASTLCIVLVHFAACGGIGRIWPESSVFTLADVGVSCFFILSGYALMQSQQGRKLEWRTYAVRRFKAIFPMFYIAWAFAFFYKFLKYRGIRPGAPAWRLILTVIGMDGYLTYWLPNFYQVGEWFLGCLLILYAFFPLLYKLIHKAPAALALAILLIYAAFNTHYSFEMSKDRFFLINLPLFAFGMYAQRWMRPGRLQTGMAAAGTLWLALCFAAGRQLGLPRSRLAIGICAFVLLMQSAPLAERIRPLRRGVRIVSRYSYAVILVHHIVEYELEALFQNRNLDGLGMIALLCLYLVITGALAYGLYALHARVMQGIARCAGKSRA